MFEREFAVVALALCCCSCADAHERATAPDVQAVDPTPAHPQEPVGTDRSLQWTRHAENGGWTPSDALLSTVVELTQGSAVDIDARLDEMTAAERVRTLRAGLRLSDGPSAVACASRLEWRQVDGWESARVVQLLTPRLLLTELPTRVFHEVRMMMASDELPAYLEALPPLPWKHKPNVLGQLHRIDRAAHLPRVVAVAMNAPEAIASAIGSNLDVACAYTDQHREQIGRFWLRKTPVHPDDRVVPENGLPQTLRRALRRDVLDWPQGESMGLDSYWFRWLRDTPPQDDDDPADRAFRLKVAEELYERSHHIDGLLALLQLGLMRDDASAALLRRLDQDEEEGAATLAIARRGDAWALAQVEAWSQDLEDQERAALALALLLEREPVRVVSVLERAIHNPDPTIGARRVALLAAALDVAPTYGIDIRDVVHLAIESTAIEHGDPLVQAVVGGVVPGCGSKDLMRSALDQWGSAPPAKLSHALAVIMDLEFGGPETLGWLELSGGKDFLAALRRSALAAPLPNDNAEPLALRMLYRLDDPEFPPELLPRIEDNFDTAPDLTLQGHASPTLETYFEGRLKTALAELDAAHAVLEKERQASRDAGVEKERAKELEDLIQDDDRAQFSVQSACADLLRARGVSPALASMSLLSDYSETVVAQIVAGETHEALVACVLSFPDTVLEDCGLIDDPRVTAHLRSLRERRELNEYWSATAELALQGDSAARKEYAHALAIGRHQVINRSSVLQRTYGMDPSTFPFLIEELESNCCRVVTNGHGDIVQELFGIDGFAFSNQARVTAYERARRRFDAAGGRFSWSRLAERLVPTPR